MPLYVYTCRTCELEMEELHPLGEAPERGIRCPLCGGYFERDVALFHVGGQRQAMELNASAAQSVRHGVTCPCCPLRRRSNSDKNK